MIQYAVPFAGPSSAGDYWIPAFAVLRQKSFIVHSAWQNMQSAGTVVLSLALSRRG
jgi:hypothetical protein